MFCEGMDDIELPGFLVDIYTLNRKNSCNQPDIEALHDPLLIHVDDGNVIPITVSECKLKNIPLTPIELKGIGKQIISEELTCSACSNVTFFIRKVGNEWLCPSCAKIKMKRPDCCGYPSGCDSCGGIVDRMILISGTLLCLRDECLMPFGYYLPREDVLLCTCEMDFLSDMEKKGLLIKDLIGIVRTHFPKKSKNTRKEIVLADLYMTRNDRCLPCQLSKRYRLIEGKSSDWEIVRGKKITCSCNFSFLTSSFSSSFRKGSSTLSTPVSRSNCLRSQSSGDLNEEYTDSTSEI